MEIEGIDLDRIWRYTKHFIGGNVYANFVIVRHLVQIHDMSEETALNLIKIFTDLDLLSVDDDGRLYAKKE